MIVGFIDRVLQQPSQSASGRVNLDPELQSRFTDLVLQSQPHELCLILPESRREPCRSLQTHRAPSVFDVAQMHSSDTESFGKLRQAFTLAFTQC